MIPLFTTYNEQRDVIWRVHCIYKLKTIDQQRPILPGWWNISGNVSRLRNLVLTTWVQYNRQSFPKAQIISNSLSGMQVLVGAGASILGNVKIGDCAKIGAAALVLSSIPAFATAVGCPAKVPLSSFISVLAQ
jgi:hypothetical protein